MSAGQVQVASEPVFIPRGRELAAGEPFEVESQDAVSRKIDTALLLVFDGLAWRAHVPVHIEDRGHFAVELFRLIKKRNGLEARDDLVPELANSITLALEHAGFLEFGLRLNPVARPTVENNIFEQMGTDAGRLRRPGGCARSNGRLGDPREQVFAELVYRYVRRQDLFAQNSADTLGVGLRPGGLRKCAAEYDGYGEEFAKS